MSLMSRPSPRLSGAPRLLCALKAQHSDQNNHNNTDKGAAGPVVFMADTIPLPHSCLYLLFVLAFSCLCQILFGRLSVLRK